MNMREKIARAINPDAGWPSNGAPPAYTAESAVANAFAKADAVLAAMEDPTEGMAYAAFREMSALSTRLSDGRDAGERVIKAAISAARSGA